MLRNPLNLLITAPIVNGEIRARAEIAAPQQGL
jgi:hypothetical protein